MPDSLPVLEAQRSQILRRIGDLSDLHPGSICAVPRRCGVHFAIAPSPTIRATTLNSA
jgi:hypothetical protein